MRACARNSGCDLRLSNASKGRAPTDALVGALERKLSVLGILVLLSAALLAALAGLLLLLAGLTLLPALLSVSLLATMVLLSTLIVLIVHC